MATITDKTIAGMVRKAKASGSDVWNTDTVAARGVGRLRFRACANGHCYVYFRYSNSKGAQDTLKIGASCLAHFEGKCDKCSRESPGATLP